MTKAISGKDVVAKAKVLQDRFETTQATLQDAQAEYSKAKAELTKFTAKFGRVLQLLTEDED